MTGVKVFHITQLAVSTHMPLARHDADWRQIIDMMIVSTHMPLARHDLVPVDFSMTIDSFYSHASCEA